MKDNPGAEYEISVDGRTARPHATSAVAASIGILPAISWNQWPLCVGIRNLRAVVSQAP